MMTTMTRFTKAKTTTIKAPMMKSKNTIIIITIFTQGKPYHRRPQI